MPKWISVLFSHCIKWTRVLVPVPLQRPRGLLCWRKHRLWLCWRKHRLCLCWSLGFSRTPQDEELQPSPCAGTAAELLTKVNVCEKLGAARDGRGRAPGLRGRRSCSSGSAGWAGPASVIALFFSYRSCWDPGVAGEGLLWLNAAWIYMCNIL